MNIVTFKRIFNDRTPMSDVIKTAMDNCDSYGQKSSILNFYAEYVEAIAHFEGKMHVVTDKQLMAYFKKKKKLNQAIC